MSLKFSCLFRLFTLFIVAGCVSYHPQPLNPSKNARSLEARRLDDLGLRRFLARQGVAPHWPNQSWSLQDLTLVAFYENPGFALQRNSVALARAAITTAGQRPNPGISFFTELNSIVIAPEETSPWALGFLFDVPFETAGKRGIRVRQAKDLATAKKFRLGQAAWDLRSLVRRHFLDDVQNLEKTGNIKQEVELQTRIWDLWHLRRMAGEASVIDENTARIALEKARLSLISAQEAEKASRTALAQSLGLPDAALKGIRLSSQDLENVPSINQLPPPSVQRAALVNRLDLRAELAQYAASEEALRLAVANQYPNFHLGPGYAFVQGDNMWALGFSVPLPILNQNQGPIAEARAKRTRAGEHVTALQFQIIGQIEDAMVHYRGSFQSLETTRKILARQKVLFRQSNDLFKEGEIGRMALMNARLSLLSATQDQLVALANTQRILESVEDAVQVPILGAKVSVNKPPVRRKKSHGSLQK